MMCLRGEKMAACTGNDFLDFHPSLFTFGSNAFNFLRRRNACFFFSSYEPIFSGSQSRTGGERWVFRSSAVVEDNPCSCCQECRLHLLLIKYNTHESLMHPKIGSIHLHRTTGQLLNIHVWGCWDACLKKCPSCPGINLRVRCHHCSHEPQVWMGYI